MTDAPTLALQADAEGLAGRYLAALEAADAAAILELFAPGAVVSSPLYGTLPATAFYSRLLGDTVASRTRLYGVASGRRREDGHPLVAIYFQYEWEVHGGVTRFHVVDILDLAADGRIDKLAIVYDTQHSRKAFSAA